VSCSYSKEALALHVEGDLTEPYAGITAGHLAACDECRRFFEELRTRQFLLKSLRREIVVPSECEGMRRAVMSRINRRQVGEGWTVRFERAFVLGFRRHVYVLAAVVVLGVLSASVVAQMRLAMPQSNEAARFEGRDTLIRPGYRDWTSVGQSQNIHVNPPGYRAYAKTGTFPEGTLLVWEPGDEERGTAKASHTGSPALLVSVKDSTRFAGGWGFFDFTGIEGTLKTKAAALPESSGCRTCHPHT
jgi:hypothetical protein